MGDYTLNHYNLDEATLLQPLKDDLGLHAVGVSLARMEPGTGYPYFHAHKEQEEIFICLQGTGTIFIGDEELTMTAGDFLRVSPEVPRAVGNRTRKPGVFLLLGALPSERYRSDESLFLIDDGIELHDRSPDWSIREDS
jgi:uncharacterized cupin superfamily protein